MAIDVETHDLTITQPIQLVLVDKSGAHVTLTIAFDDRPPITHSFEFDEGSLTIPVALPTGRHRCSFVIQAFKHGTLNRKYDAALNVNGQLAAAARGSIPKARSSDVGFGDFVLTLP